MSERSSGVSTRTDRIAFLSFDDPDVVRQKNYYCCCQRVFILIRPTNQRQPARAFLFYLSANVTSKALCVFF